MALNDITAVDNLDGTYTIKKEIQETDVNNNVINVLEEQGTFELSYLETEVEHRIKMIEDFTSEKEKIESWITAINNLNL